jgi:predicted nucleotidyltransferase
VPYGSIDKTLRELVQDQLVIREEDASGPRYRAPHEDPRLAGLFSLIRQDSIIVDQLKRVFKSAKQVEYAAVFGSFASGTTRKDSDIDVLVVESPEADRFQLMGALAKVAERVHISVDPQFYSSDEFRAKLGTGDPLILGILANPRIDLRGNLPWQS